MPELSFEDRRDQLQREATDFDANTVRPWYDDIVTLDASTIRARGTKIIDGWEKLLAANSALASSGASTIRTLKADDEAAVAPVTAGDQPTDDAPLAQRPAPSLAEVQEIANVKTSLGVATARLDRSRKLIGNVVGLQDFNNHAVLGRYRVFETGADPTIFVDSQVERTIHAFSIIMRAGAVCDRWLGNFSATETEKLVAIVEETRNDLEYRFVMEVLRYLGYAEAVYSIDDSPKARMVAHHDKLQTQDAATRDGGGVISPELAQQMTGDVDRLAVALDAGLDLAIGQILDKYEDPPEAKRVFARLIERRGIGDTLMLRDRARVEAFLGRELDATAAFDRSPTAAIAEVGGEAARQTPGALCMFMSGVYAGMGSLPVIGGSMKEASAAYKDLAKIADEATGAWQDGIKTRNTIAWWTGFSVEKLAEVVVTRGMAGGRAATALAETANAKDAVDMASTCAGYVTKARKIYDDASWMWKLAIEQLPVTLSTVRDGIALCRDPSDVVFDAGIDLTSAAFDTCMGAVKKKLNGTFTAEGRVAREAAKQPATSDAIADDRLPADVRDALNRLRAAQDGVTHAKDDIEGFHAGFEAKQAAEDLKAALAANRDVIEDEQIHHDREQAKERSDKVKQELSGGLPAVIGDKFCQFFINGGIGVVKGMKTAFVKELKASRKLRRDGKQHGLDPERLKKALAIAAGTAAVTELRDVLIAELKGFAQDQLVGYLAGVIDDHYPGTRTVAEEALKDPIGNLLSYIAEDLPEDWLEARVTDAVSALVDDDAPEGDE